EDGIRDFHVTGVQTCALPILNFPSSGRRGRFDRRSDEDIKKESEKAVKEANDIWDNAKKYLELKKSGAELQYYPEMDQLSKAVSGELPLLIVVDAASDIQNAIKWVKDKDIKVIFSGVAEGWRVARSEEHTSELQSRENL